MLRNIPSLVVFHVTPMEYIHSIKLNGIDPRYSRGVMKVSWYCAKRHIEWAVIHCSVQHHVYPDEMMVLAVLAQGKDLVTFFQPGRYHTDVILYPESYTPAMFFLHEVGKGDNENE